MAKKQKKIRRNVVKGIAHIKSKFNNTIVTISDTNGDALCADSAGTIGFKGARKATPFAATRAGEACGNKARKMGMVEIEVRLTGAGPGREAAINGLASTGLKVTALEDHTAVPHNGCRPRKKRRV